MTFLAPWFLLAAAAAAVPVLLHLIHRQQAPQQAFSTLRFLKQSVERTRRRRRIHDLLLLLLRAGALVLLALGLAGPTLRNARSLLGDGRAAVAIVLDNSASMALRDAGRPRWDSAKIAVEQILATLQPGDAVALLPTCGPPQPAAARWQADPATVRQLLDDCRVSYERADLAARVAQARELLARSDLPHGELYVISDLQTVSCEGLLEPSPSAGEPGQVATPLAAQPTVVVDVSATPAPNVAAAKLSLDVTLPAAGMPVQVQVELRNQSATPQPRDVQLWLDGVLVQTSPTLELAPGAVQPVSFTLALPGAGFHRGEVRLSGEDGSPQDDRLHFALVANPPFRVAVVQPERHAVDYLQQSYYLQRALALGGTEAVAVEPLTLAELGERPLSAYDVLYVCNAAPPTDPAELARWRQFVEAGGAICWFFGAEASSVSLNEPQRGLLACPLGESRAAGADAPDGWTLAYLAAAHPALGPLTEPAALYQSVRVQRHTLLDAPQEHGAEVLIGLSDGQPLLVERNLGRGKLLEWGISAHAADSNLVVRPFFLPLLGRLTFYLAGVQQTHGSLIAGTPLVPAWGGATHSGALQVVRPDGEIWQADYDPAGEGVTFLQTHEPGAYEVRLTTPQRERLLGIAVNPDPDECDPGHADVAALQAVGGPQFFLCQSADQVLATIQQMRSGRSLRGPLLALAVLVLLAESWVANRLAAVPGSAASPAASAARRLPERVAATTEPPPAPFTGAGGNALRFPRGTKTAG